MGRVRERRRGRPGDVSAGKRIRTGAARTKDPWQVLLLLALALLPVATFWSVLHNDFIEYDDPDYVTRNEWIHRGLTWAGLRWALTTGYAANWHPLTWLSHMADISLFGLNPPGHHATNLLLHVTNTLLVFLLFRSLTGDRGRSAAVAALFAIHPAHVESVAWVAERKDLLCAAFWFATTWAYGSWVRKGGGGRYLAVLLFFAAGLMSKPMIVSLPLVLLLVDYWPLGRFGDEDKARAPFLRTPRGLAGLTLEKTPLFLMAAASSLVTFLSQRAGGSVRSLEMFPLWARVGNACAAYIRYLRMLVWPANLVIFYPHPGTSLSAATVFGAALLLVALSTAAIALRRRAPFLFVGWFWFLVTLVPVIGVVQVGYQALADRYTYIPFTGLFVAIAWGFPEIVSRWRYGSVALRAGSAAVLLALSLAAAAQARVWKNSETVFLHALKTTKNNDLADNNLGHYYNETGRPLEAMPYLSEATRINPTNPGIRNNLGVSFFLLGRFEEAFLEFSQALRLKPDSALALNNLARTRFVQGEIPDAVRFYEAAVAQAPESAEIRRKLAVALLMEGKVAPALRQLQRESILSPANAECRQLLADVATFGRNRDDPSLGRFRKYLAAAHLDASAALYARERKTEATLHLRKAIELFPASAAAHNELGTRLVEEGRLDEAGAEFQRALGIDPGLAGAYNNLGYVLFLKGRRAEAVEQYREALRLQPEFPLARHNLEQALSEAGGK
jgi:Flp pilus assembly protein TadD